MKEKQINLRLSEDIKKQVESKAASTGMTVSEYIRYLIIKELEK